jgi:hypothetical protein
MRMLLLVRGFGTNASKEDADEESDVNQYRKEYV